MTTLPNLIRTRPLAAQAAQHPVPSEGSQVLVGERPLAALTNLRLAPKAAKPLKAALGLVLPTKANTVSESDQGLRCLWLAPDEWLLIEANGDGTALAASVTAALDGVHHSAKDLSDNYATIRLSGIKARAVLAKLTPFDTHASLFTLGQCAQTILAKSNLILDVISDDAAGLCLDMYMRRSFAAYVWERLIDAGLEFQVGVVGAA